MPVLMITAYATPKLAVEAIKAGAIDYLAKPFAPEELLHAVARCAERHQLLQENAVLRARTSRPINSEHIIGDSPRDRGTAAADSDRRPTNATVLILGESGTGKELIAGALHTLSERRKAHYVRINCAAIPETLLESELFGHEKGAFTGALKQKLGRVEEADGGTIFLDEIGDMSRPLQAKLLRFLEDGTFTRVGGNEELRVDVRLIAATNRDIVEAIRQNQFREDLFHRLNVVQFRPPPLRERGAGRGAAGGAFSPTLQHHDAQADQDVSRRPPNKSCFRITGREMCVNCATSSSARSFWKPPRKSRRGICRTSTRKRLRKRVAHPHRPASRWMTPWHISRRELIRQTLEQNHFSVSRAAEHLKISRHALRYRMQRLNIHSPRMRRKSRRNR